MAILPYCDMYKTTRNKDNDIQVAVDVSKLIHPCLVDITHIGSYWRDGRVPYTAG